VLFRSIPTGLRALDAALPRGGLPLGAITEIVSDGAGVGAMTLAMRTLRHCRLSIVDCRLGEVTSPLAIDNRQSTIDNSSVVFIDTCGDFYPPAVAAFGLSLDRLIVVRPRSERDALWATDQALRCSVVAAVIAPLRRLDERASRRLQLAAESSGVLGLILRPARDRVKTFAAVRMMIDCRLSIVDCRLEGLPIADFQLPIGEDSRLPPSSLRRFVASSLSSSNRQSTIANRQSPRFCRITLLKVREGRPAGPILVDLHHETGDGPLPSVPLDRSAAAG